MNSWSQAMSIPPVKNNGKKINATDEVTYEIPNPGTVNISYVSNYTYLPLIHKDKTYTWTVAHLEKTSGFHIAEGDKKIKKGDRIHIKIAADVQKDLPHPENWALVYVNDVRAGYSNKEQNVLAIWKYFLPTSLNISDVNGTYRLYSIIDELRNDTHWTIGDNLLTYNYNVTNNSTMLKLTLTYDRSLLLLNELHLSVKLIVDEKSYSANLTIIRLHGWGLPYYTSTLVVWIPLGAFFVLLIVAIRLKLIQKIKLYFEARKLVKKE